MLPLILYDIPSKLPGRAWSPNTAKTRFVLGYKNLPFETHWVEYPDIAPKLKEIGASPTKLPDGGDKYTLPVLSDSNTGALVSDSWDIAEYLDTVYPEKHIFPKGSKGLISAFTSAMITLRGPSQQKLTFLRTLQNLNEHSVPYFITSKEAYFGKKVDEWSPEGPKRDADWAIIERFFVSAKDWYDKVEGKWVMGDTICFADILLAAYIFWFKRMLPDDEWIRIASLQDGKWAKFMVDVKKECNVNLTIN